MDPAANQLRTPDLAPEGPTYDSGNIPPAGSDPAPAPQPAARTVQEDAADRGEPKQWTDDRRSEIFANARQRRQQETQPFSGDPNDPDALYGSDVDQSDLGELEKEALRRRQNPEFAQQGQQQGQQPQRKPLNGLDPQFLSQTVPIVVDGETREITVEEALRNYQIEEAAKRRLEQAKMLLAQSQEFQRVNAQPAYTPENEPSGQEDSSSDDQNADRGYTSQRRANVTELVEKIQLGTPDEAAQALEEFVSSAVNREPAVDETTRVLTALEDANSKQAVLQFAQAYPQIAQSPELQAATTREVQRQMALDLIRAGYPVEQLRQLAPDAASLTQLHKQARIQRLNGVRPVSELMTAGYHGALEGLRQLVGQAAPQSQPNPASMQQRQQRKESLQPQPTARRLQPSLAQASPARSQEQSRSAAVARIRQSRGQPV